MNNFDRKWQSCVAQARQAPQRDDTAPFGFAARVQSLATSTSAPAVSLELVWQRLTWQSLLLAGTALIVCAIVELPHLRDAHPLEPGIENAVAQLVWSL
jgi:hypothetical protein